MKKSLAIVLGAILCAILTGAGGTQPRSQPPVRFVWLDVFVDSKGQPLAAYQFELSAPRGQITIVGIENGTHPAYREAPYYDPKAMKNNRAIIAAFNTGKNLPTEKAHVASLNIMVTGEAEPDWTLALTVAADPNGNEIPAAISFETGERK